MLNIALEESKDPFGIKLILSRYGIKVCISCKEAISDAKAAMNSLALGCRIGSYSNRDGSVGGMIEDEISKN